jgi:hypothetical protein
MAPASVSAYTIDATSGALTQVAGSPFGPDDGASGVAVDSTGKVAFVSYVGSQHRKLMTERGGSPARIKRYRLSK